MKSVDVNPKHSVQDCWLTHARPTKLSFNIVGTIFHIVKTLLKKHINIYEQYLLISLLSVCVSLRILIAEACFVRGMHTLTWSARYRGVEADSHAINARGALSAGRSAALMQARSR